MSRIKEAQGDYETVAAGVTAQVLGASGAKGDIIERLHLTVSTTATGTVTILDDDISITLVAASGLANGKHTLELGVRSKKGAWKITTGEGVALLAVGKFS